MADIPWTPIGITAAIVGSLIFIICCCCVCCRKRNTKGRSGKTNREKKQYSKIPTSHTLDLHGHSVKSARSHLKTFLKQEQRSSSNGGTKQKRSIITGKGNHSPGGRPVLKPVVEKQLKKNGYKYKVDPKNAGRIIVDRDYYDMV